MRRCEEIPKRATGQGVGMGCPHISPQLNNRVEALFTDGTCWSVARLGLVYRLRGLSMCPYLSWIGASGSAARWVEYGSPGRIRTYNLAVNSRPLYR